MLFKIGRKQMVNKKQTSDKIASLGSQAMQNPKSLTPSQIKSLGASAVSQSNPKKGKN